MAGDSWLGLFVNLDPGCQKDVIDAAEATEKATVTAVSSFVESLFSSESSLPGAAKFFASGSEGLSFSQRAGKTTYRGL